MAGEFLSKAELMSRWGISDAALARLVGTDQLDAAEQDGETVFPEASVAQLERSATGDAFLDYEELMQELQLNRSELDGLLQTGRLMEYSFGVGPRYSAREVADLLRQKKPTGLEKKPTDRPAKVEKRPTTVEEAAQVEAEQEDVLLETRATTIEDRPTDAKVVQKRPTAVEKKPTDAQVVQKRPTAVEKKPTDAQVVQTRPTTIEKKPTDAELVQESPTTLEKSSTEIEEVETEAAQVDGFMEAGAETVLNVEGLAAIEEEDIEGSGFDFTEELETDLTTEPSDALEGPEIGGAAPDDAEPPEAEIITDLLELGEGESAEEDLLGDIIEDVGGDVVIADEGGLRANGGLGVEALDMGDAEDVTAELTGEETVDADTSEDVTAEITQLEEDTFAGEELEDFLEPAAEEDADDFAFPEAAAGRQAESPVGGLMIALLVLILLAQVVAGLFVIENTVNPKHSTKLTAWNPFLQK